MMHDFQVPVTYEARGYVTVAAESRRDAKAKVRALVVRMDYIDREADLDMMPDAPDLMINGEPVLVEPEEE